ncbi:MAG: YcgN family cysteine cluster protein [Gammaproteobacteria bacterium]|nr:YcgN family cysteine cluster protein [Gammaproteobacteria bacterium]
MADTGFWLSKSLAQMNREEWEMLCDGCGQCCLIKLEDEDTGEVYRTSVSCHMLDLNNCRCRDYQHRFDKVAECVEVTLDKPEQFEWMPKTCAYRLLYENKPLFDWHPLLNPGQSVVLNNEISVRHFAISEEYVHPDQLQDYISNKIE